MSKRDFRGVAVVNRGVPSKKSKLGLAVKGVVESLENRWMLSALPTPLYGAPVDASDPGNATDSAPSAAYNPVDPTQRVAVWSRTTNAGIRLVGAASVDSGATWTEFAFPNNLRDPDETTALFEWAIDPTVAFDRNNNFYVTYTQRSSDATDQGADGAIVLQKFDFGGGAPTPSIQDQILTAWLDGLDPARNPTLAVDSTLPTFTDPTTGNTVTNPSANNIYVAWTRAFGAQTEFIEYVGSVDGAASFTNPERVSDPSFSPTRVIRPTIAIAQGNEAGTVQPGRASVFFTDTTSGRGSGVDIILTDTISGNGASVGVGVGVPIVDALAGPGGASSTVLPVTLTTPPAAAAVNLTDLNVRLTINHQAMNTLSATLTSPTGISVVLFGINDLNGANLGVTANTNVAVGTIFDDDARQDIDGPGVAAPRIGTFRPAAGALLSDFNVLTGATAAGSWTLTIVDSANGTTGTVVDWSLTASFAPNNGVGGVDVEVAQTNVLGSSRLPATPPTNAPSAPLVGVASPVSAAYDNSLGSFARSPGRLYVAFVVGSAPADNTEISLTVSDDGGLTWAPLDRFVNDDSANDGFSGADRAQFQPNVAVDSATGMVVLSWQDARFDAGRARTVTMVTASNDITVDAGLGLASGTFSRQIFANPRNLGFDVAASTERIIGPFTDNFATGAFGTSAILGQGERQSLMVFDGLVQPVWSSNLNGGQTNSRRSTISVGNLRFPSGPRIVGSTTGLVSAPGDTLNPATPAGPTLQSIEVTFDRRIDPASFTPADVTVMFRTPSQSGNTAGTVIPVISVTPDVTETIFTIAIAPQTAVGTYSYFVSPNAISDRSRVRNGTVTRDGNLIDQNGDGVQAEAQTTTTIGDAYAIPKPTGANSFNGTFFTPAFDSLSLPLMISGPRIVETGIAGGPLSADNENLFLNVTASGLDIRFDRDMDPTTITPASVLAMFGPLGVVTSGFTITADPLGTDPDPAFPRTYRISLPSQTVGPTTYPGQVISGPYSLQLAETITDKNGNALDTDTNGGLDALRGVPNPSNSTSTVYTTGTLATPLSTAVNGVVDIPLNITDSRVIDSITVRLSINTSNTTRYRGELVGPDGTTVLLFSSVGQSGTRTNFSNTVFDDNATTAISSGGAPFFGSFRPQQFLAAFNTTQAQGTWRLRITTLAAPATGTVTNLTLTIGSSVSGTSLGTIADRPVVPFRVFTLDPAKSLSSSNWTAVGPASAAGHSGRIGGLAVDASDPSGNTVFAAGASGGVWKTTNFLTTDANGPRWIPLTDFGPTRSLKVGSIAVFSRNNDPDQSIIFVATGEGDTGTQGVGFLRSVDGGRTWDVLDSTDNRARDGQNQPTTDISNIASVDRDHAFVGNSSFKVVVDPKLTPSGEVVVYAAVIDGQGDTRANGGIWRSTDTGRTWRLMRAGQATDVALDFRSATVNAQGATVATVGNVDIIYAGFRGEGVFLSPNRGVVWNALDGGVGKPLLRDGNGGPAVPVTAPLDTPQGANGRISLVTPFLTNSPRDLLQQGWVWALVTTPSTPGNPVGRFDGLYMTKDYGQNWTKVRIPISGGLPTNNTASPDLLIVTNAAPEEFFGQAIAIDPTDPNIVYVGGQATGGTPQLIRVDATLVADAHAFFERDNGVNTPARPQSRSLTGQLNQPGVNPQFVSSPTSGTLLDGNPLIDPIINLLRDPQNPADGNATQNAVNISLFTNDGSGATWTAFDSILTGNDIHRMITFIDPLTGRTRLIVGNDHMIGTGVDVQAVSDFPEGSSATGGYLDSLGGTTITRDNRVGNLQIGQLYYGAAQPSLGGAITAAFLYAANQDGGAPASATDPITTGQVAWPNGSNTGDSGQVATDPQGKGFVYRYLWPTTGGRGTDFFQVFDPADNTHTGGIGRTNGLLQVGDDPANNAGQWRRSGRAYFAVNQVNGDQLMIGSHAGRIFATTNQGRFWTVIGDPAALDNTQSLAMAFGAPPVSGPTGALNDLMYVGTEGGSIFVTFTGGGGNGNEWSELPGLDGSPVRSIITNPARGSFEAYAVTLNGVYWMRDSSAPGATWVDISSNIANIQFNAFGNTQYAQDRLLQLQSIAADWRYIIPDNTPGRAGSTFPLLYAAGEGGVYRSFDRGASWELFPNIQDDAAVADGGLMPNTTVSDLDLSLGPIDPTNGRPDYAQGQNLLIASTYGRGMFAIRVAPLIIPQTLRLLPADDSGVSSTDLITNVATFRMRGVSQASAFGNLVNVTIVDMTDPLNPRIIGGFDPNVPSTGTNLANRTDEFGNFTVAVDAGALTASGVYTIGVFGTDPSGLVSQPTLVTITLDITPPTAPAITGLTTGTDTGASSTDGITFNRTPTIFGTADNNATVQVFVDAVLAGTAVANGTGQWTFTFATALAEGVRQITASQTDPAGNASVTSGAFTITVDATAPAAIATPTLAVGSDSGAADGITSVRQPTLNGTAPANTTVRIFNGTTLLFTTTALGNGTWSFTPSTPLADGQYNFNVRAEDVAGNQSPSSQTLRVTIDSTAPTLPPAPALFQSDDTGISNTDRITRLRTPRIAGTAEALTTVEILENGIVIGSGTAAADGTYSIAVISALADGAHVLAVRSRDTAGNQSANSGTVSITVDGTAPTSVAVPITGTKNQPFSGSLANFIDAGAFGTAVIDWGDGTTSNGTASGSPLSISASKTYAATGVFNYSVTVTDAAGNQTVATSTATISGAPVQATGGFSVTAVEGLTSAVQTVATFVDTTGAEPISSYLAQINWGDGLTSVGTVTAGTNPNSFVISGSHQYATEGQYVVSVTVSYGGVNPVTVTSSAVVTQGAVALTPVPFNVPDGQAFEGIVATFLDPGTGSIAADFTGTIAWGDGTTSPILRIEQDTTNPRLFRVVGTKTYPGGIRTYDVVVTVLNKGGPSASVNTTASVVNVTPVPRIVGQSVIFVGILASFTLAADDSAFDQATGLTYTVNWGDNSALVTVPATANNGTGVQIQKTYATVGTYTVTVTATDSSGASSQVTRQVTVSSLPVLSQPTVNGGSTTTPTSNVSTIGFTLGANGTPLPSLTVADLALVRNKFTPVSLTGATLNFNTTTGVGSADLSALPLEDGFYELKINIPNGNSSTVRFSRLLGDLNGDGVVNTRDSRLLRASLGKSPGQTGYLAAADLNRDGAINATDTSFLKFRNGNRLIAKTQTVRYRATGNPPTASFRGQAFGETVVQDIVVRNTERTRTLTLRQLGVTPVGGAFEFEIVGSEGSTEATLAPGQSMTLRVYFRPTSVSTFRSSISFFQTTGDGSSTLRTIQLLGRGVR